MSYLHGQTLPCYPHFIRTDRHSDRRLLAHAGFDARKAVQFWENRQENTQTRECSASCANLPASSNPNLARRIMGSTHPMNEMRISKLKDELVRWELERRVAVSRRDAERTPS
jgi:hypothetical protein